MLQFFSKLRRSRPAEAKAAAVKRLERVLGQLGHPVAAPDAELRAVTLPLAHTYRVTLYAWPVADARVCLVASFDYRVDRDFILRELALDLLEENNALTDEAFVLIPRADHDRLIGCRRFLSLNDCSYQELLTACKSLIERTQRMLARVYAKGLIPSGPSTIGRSD